MQVCEQIAKERFDVLYYDRCGYTNVSDRPRRLHTGVLTLQ